MGGGGEEVKVDVGEGWAEVKVVGETLRIPHKKKLLHILKLSS